MPTSDCKTCIPVDGGKAIAVVRGLFKGSIVSGIVTFTQPEHENHLLVSVNITGLPEGQGTNQHGLHIHNNGITVLSNNVTEICNSAGAHYNPIKLNHGSRTSTARHIGDFGNVASTDDGTINVIFKDKVAKLYGVHGIIGRTVVLHADKDDLGLGGDEGSLKTGNAGSRIACGVIGVSN